LSKYELFERNERGARDAAPSEWSENNEWKNSGDSILNEGIRPPAPAWKIRRSKIKDSPKINKVSPEFSESVGV